MSHEDNHVIRRHPDDESIEFETNEELGRDEERAINQRVKWAREQRAKRESEE